MSARDVELVQQAYEFFGLTGSLPLHLFAPDIVWKVDALPEGQLLHGHEGIATLMSTLPEMFEGYRAEPEQYEDLRDGRVLVAVRQHGKAKESGVDLSLLGAFFHIWTVGAGKIVRHEAYFDKAKALEAAGLTR
jgi:ketosteroid isomerase-like protein